MDKLISLQRAIDAVHKNYDTILDFTSDGKTISSSIEDILSELPSAEPESISEWKKEFREYVDSLDIARDDWKGIIEYIDELPSIQPNHCAEVGKKVLIDRQEALEIIRKMQTYKLFAGDDMILVDKAQVQTELMMLPSAQPDTTTHDSVPAETGKNDGDGTSGDCISRQAAIDAICTEGTRLERNGTVAMVEIKQWCIGILEALPSAQPERTCVNCGRTANNGGWYADGRTRCPIEEHYALPKDGYCHLWEKRNVTDDDYPERQEK